MIENEPQWLHHVALHPHLTEVSLTPDSSPVACVTTCDPSSGDDYQQELLSSEIE